MTYVTTKGKTKLGAVAATWYQNSSRKKNAIPGCIMKPRAYADSNTVPSIGRYRFPTISITTTNASQLRK